MSIRRRLERLEAGSARRAKGLEGPDPFAGLSSGAEVLLKCLEAVQSWGSPFAEDEGLARDIGWLRAYIAGGQEDPAVAAECGGYVADLRQAARTGGKGTGHHP